MTSQAIYTGDGTINTFSVPFPYIHRSHIVALVDASVASFTWLSATSIQITPTPAVNAVVQIKRVTPADPLVVYQAGAALPVDDLNTAVLQALYLNEEARRDFLNLPSEIAEKTAGITHSYPVVSGQTVVDVSDIQSPFYIGQVFYNGVFQATSAYERAGTTIVFNEELPADGVVNVVAVFRSADNYIDGDALPQAKAYADAGDATTMAAAKDYADAGDSQVATNANAYTDAAVMGAKAYADAADDTAIATAQIYTDSAVAAGAVGVVKGALNLGSGVGLFASKVGTDLRFKGLAAGTGISLSSDGTTVTITATGGGGSGGSTTLAGMTDVYEVDVAQFGEVLVYDPTYPAGAGWFSTKLFTGYLSDLALYTTNIDNGDLGEPYPGDVPVWDPVGNKYVNRNPHRRVATASAATFKPDRRYSNYIVMLTNAGGCTVTLPEDGYKVNNGDGGFIEPGDSVWFYQATSNTGGVTFAAGPGATVSYGAGTEATSNTIGQLFECIYLVDNSWLVQRVGGAAGAGGAVSSVNGATGAVVLTATNITCQQPVSGAVARPTQEKLSDVVSVKDFGAKGDGINDDTAAIQACIMAVFATGGTVYFPAGKYRITTKLYLDVRGVTGAPNTNQRRVNFRGCGSGNTVLMISTNTITGLHIQGDNPLTSASHAYITISDLAFAGNSPSPRTCTGLRLQDLAYLAVRDVSFHNLNVDLYLNGCLSSRFDGLIFNESTTGVLADAGASGPHSNLWSGCEFRFCTSLGYDGQTALSGATFDNCRFESCGTQGNSSTGGVRQSTTGTAGEHGMTFVGCYIEGNRGGFDIQVNETSTQRVTLNLHGNCFNRVSSSNYVTNNIVTTGDVDVNASGNTFTSYNSYVPSAARPYLNLSSTTRFRDLGNRFEDVTEAPTIAQSLPYAGFVQGSLGAGVVGTLPPGWTVSRVSTGIFQITHNLGHTDYAPTATAVTGNNRVVQRCVRSSNTLQVKVTDPTGTAMDDDFSFSLQILKPRS